MEDALGFSAEAKYAGRDFALYSFLAVQSDDGWEKAMHGAAAIASASEFFFRVLPVAEIGVSTVRLLATESVGLARVMQKAAGELPSHLPRTVTGESGHVRVGGGNTLGNPSLSGLVRRELPPMPRKLGAEFEGEARLRTFRTGDRVYRSSWPGETSGSPGRWYGTRKAATRTGNESMYQLDKVKNPNAIQRTYEFKQDATVYYGRVKGGTGYQIYAPEDVKPKALFKYIDETELR
jgi:hypothetical protein